MTTEPTESDLEPAASARPLVVAVVILLLSAATGWWIYTTGPTQEKVPRAASTPTVDVVPLVARDEPLTIRAFGTVEPAREVSLSPEVEGRVTAIHAQFEPGATIREGEVLLRVDPADYRIAVRRAEAALASAQAALDLEAGQRTVAEREWELFAAQQGQPADTSPALALREPQMKQAQARLETARAELDAAQLALRRTELRVPWDAMVAERLADIGRRVGPGTPVATLVGVDEFWVRVTLPIDAAERLASLPPQAPVRITLATGLGEDVVREGKFVRRLPGVESEGRMARALLAISDPLGVESGAPPIPLQSYVRADIDGGRLEAVHRIPREALRENGQVWVRDRDGVLRFRDVQVAWRGEDAVFVRAEFADGDSLVTSYLANPLPGVEVRVRKEP